MYDFKKGADRSQDGSIKTGAAPMKNDPSIIPMWVADMDFETLPEVKEALVRRAQFGVFGYTRASDAFFQAAVDWLERRHGLAVRADWLVPVDGIVSGLKILIQALTRPEDEILIFTPAYPPFKSSVELNGRRCVEFALLEGKEGWIIDFEALEAQLAHHKVRMLIFCSPHNPVGRVWKLEELAKLAKLCEKYDILLVSDEIHMDFARLNRHIPLMKAYPQGAEHMILCIAPSKTFNLAGLHTGLLVVPSKEDRQKIQDVMSRNGIAGPSIMGLEAATAAWEHGDIWVDDLNAQISRNARRVEQWAAEKMPMIRVSRPEGLYLLWLDCRSMEMSAQELESFFTDQAKVFLNQGYTFGKNGEGFVRMNIACGEDVLDKALQQIETAWKARTQN